MVTRQLACVLVVLGSGCASSQSSGSGEALRPIGDLHQQIGIGRVLFGADGAVGGHTPLSAWRAFRKLPLTEEEFRVIARNVPPHMR